MPKATHVLGDWRGGLNTDNPSEAIADNELSLADNAVIDERGPVRKRKGVIPLSDTPQTYDFTQVFEWGRDDGTTVLLAVAYVSATEKHFLGTIDGDGVFTSIQEVKLPQIGSCSLRDVLYFVDGDELYQYDGTTVAAVVAKATDEESNPIVDNGIDAVRECKFLLWNPQNYRLYAAGNPDNQAALYFSEPNDPTYWKSTSVLFPTEGDGPVTAICMFSHALLTFYSRSVRAWKGISPDDASWLRVPTPHGTDSPMSICLTPNSLTYLGNGALVAINPSLLDYSLVMVPGNELVMNLSNGKVSKLIQGIKHMNTACAIYDPDNERYLLAYGDDVNDSRNNKVLCLHWNLRAYTRWTGWAVNGWCLRENHDLLFGTHKFIHKTKQLGYADIDDAGGQVPITFAMTTAKTSLQIPFHKKKVSRIYLSAHNAEDSQAAVYSVELVTGADSAYFPDVTVQDGMSWGDVWGTNWPMNLAQTLEFRVSLKGERFQVKIVNNRIGENPMVYGIGFLFRPKRLPGGIKINAQTS